MNDGYILLLRKIMDTSFYKNVNTCHLAIHCLLRANFRKTKLVINKEDFELMRGQFITSIEHLSNETGLSRQNTRTSLKILANTKFLTKESTNQMTIIKINKYDELQAFKELTIEQTNNRTNKPLTNDQQATNKPLTTDNEVNTLNTLKELTPVQLIVEEFKKLKGYDKIKDWNKQHFSRYLKPAKKMLEILPINECLEVLQLEGTKLNQGTKREDWVLEWVIAKIPDYQLKKQAEVKKQQEQQEAQDRYAKLEESRKRTI